MNGERCSGKIGGVGADKFTYDLVVAYEEDGHPPSPDEEEDEFANE